MEQENARLSSNRVLLRQQMLDNASDLEELTHKHNSARADAEVLRGELAQVKTALTTKEEELQRQQGALTDSVREVAVS